MEFVVERIKEIVEESIGNDHTMFSDLFDGHSQTRSTSRLLEAEAIKEKLARSAEHLLSQKEEELSYCKMQFKQTFAHAEQLEAAVANKQAEINEIQQEIADLKRVAQEAVDESLEMRGKYEVSQQQVHSLQTDVHSMKSQCFEAQLLLKRMTVEMAAMKEALQLSENDKAMLLERFNEYGEQLQRQQNDIVE